MPATGRNTKGLKLGSGVTQLCGEYRRGGRERRPADPYPPGQHHRKILGTLTVTSTGGYGIFKEQSIAIAGISGVQDIYLTFSGGLWGGGNIDYFRFY